MTRLEAIKAVRRGERIDAIFTPDSHGVSRNIIVAMYYVDVCDFPRRRRSDHETIGPIHCMFFAGGYPDWVHITPKQLLGFIRRNFPRK